MMLYNTKSTKISKYKYLHLNGLAHLTVLYCQLPDEESRPLHPLSLHEGHSHTPLTPHRGTGGTRPVAILQVGMVVSTLLGLLEKREWF